MSNQLPPSNLGISVKVLNISDGQGPNPAGGFVKGRNVTYQLSTGHTGTVFIPMDSFNEDAVRAAIATDAANVARVANLTVTI